MLHTYQIIDGFEALLGPETIHIPMFIALIALMGYPGEDTGEEAPYIRKMWWTSAFYHFCASAHHIAKRFPKARSRNIMQNLGVALILIQVYLTVRSMIVVWRLRLVEYRKEEDEEMNAMQ